VASLITLRRRITSIKGTSKITKAMELVSASKLRRAQEYAAASRDYRDLAYELLKRLNAIGEVERTPFYRIRPVKSRLYIIVTSNTGLAGAYNANVLKQLTQHLQTDEEEKIKSHVITIGSKGAQFVRRLHNVELLAAYPPFSDQPQASEVLPILKTILSRYAEENVDEVHLIFTRFKSTVVQEVQSQQLLPAPAPEADSSIQGISNLEPDVETVVESVTTRLLEAQLWQAVLESQASEHAMRMLATKNATDNANDLIKDYTLELNTARQAAITQELAEISGGAEALNG
jgi:F-type H+-transporting ATPase subunit gamma